jgi:hypothetical protein
MSCYDGKLHDTKKFPWLHQVPEQYIKNSDPNLYKPYNTFSLQMYKVIVKFWL